MVVVVLEGPPPLRRTGGTAVRPGIEDVPIPLGGVFHWTIVETGNPALEVEVTDVDDGMEPLELEGEGVSGGGRY